MENNIKIDVFTDGSCLKNPGGKGGAAAIFVQDNKQLCVEGEHSTSTTNNRMELYAVVMALKKALQISQNTTNNPIIEKLKKQKLSLKSLSIRSKDMEILLNQYDKIIKNIKTTSYTFSIYTDSKYLCEGYNNWISGWIKNNWKNTSNKEVKNQDLWMEILEYKKQLPHLKIHWVKAHTSNKDYYSLWNSEADKLANKMNNKTMG